MKQHYLQKIASYKTDLRKCIKQFMQSTTAHHKAESIEDKLDFVLDICLYIHVYKRTHICTGRNVQTVAQRQA